MPSQKGEMGALMQELNQVEHRIVSVLPGQAEISFMPCTSPWYSSSLLFVPSLAQCEPLALTIPANFPLNLSTPQVQCVGFKPNSLGPENPPLWSPKSGHTTNYETVTTSSCFCTHDKNLLAVALVYCRAYAKVHIWFASRSCTRFKNNEIS